MAVTFRPRSVEVAGGFTVNRPAAEVFELFSPLGEKRWVPGWSPELLHPPGASWERGLIFRTPGERGDVVWIVGDLDRTLHHVEYHRLDPGRTVARVTVRCTPLDSGETEVRVAYAYVGLADDGNAEIARTTTASHAARMEQWKRWIDAYLARGDGA
jgi:hypothetical protein